MARFLTRCRVADSIGNQTLGLSTPHVIRGSEEGDEVMEELRRQLRLTESIVSRLRP
jgi:hypothetical protein